jgi:hypothetical protein
MGVTSIDEITVGLLLVGLSMTGLACSDRLLVGVADADAGAAGGGGMGGAAAFTTGGATGMGGSQLSAQIFSQGNDKLDLLFMIDNSASMAPLQNKLLASLPVFMDALKGLPGGLPDIHVAVISSDTGPGGYDLPNYGCRFQGDRGLFQTQARGACITSPLAPGQAFLQASGNQAQKNYAGDITDALTCIAALGDGGCGFEGPLKSVRWALDPNPNDGPAGTAAANAGFLRDDAYLAVILFTNEDDCSVPDDSDLFDPTQQHMSDPYGPFASFRCNEFGHLCFDDNGAPRAVVRGVNTDRTNCVSNETPTSKETSLSDELTFLWGLKSDPSLVFAAAIAGPVTPYNVAMSNRTLPDGSVELQPSVEHSCVENSGEYADPAARIQQWARAFQDNGAAASICADSFAPALAQVAAAVSRPLGPPCVTGAFLRGLEEHDASCVVVDRTTSSGTRVDTALTDCAFSPAGQPCWTLSSNPALCPDGQQLIVSRFGAAPPTLGTSVACLPTPD